MKSCPQCGAEYELDAQFCLKDGATLQSLVPAPDLVGTIVADRYKVLRKLGEGGMGQVYLAEHVRIRRKSALKVVRPDLAAEPDAVARFNREAANASRIDHPHVAAIYDFGETRDGLVYLAMEFIEGESLGALLKRSGGRLPPRRVARIVAQAADALAAAHELGIVHRDLKPDNIMIGRHRDGSDRVKVVDFGLAKIPTVAEQKVTTSGAIVGTPAFMSPEQVVCEVVDGRSDQYSLALVAFDALTGELPFAAQSVQQLLAMRVTERPRTLSEARPGVRWPEAAEAVFARALSSRREARYGDVVAFAQALEAAVAMMPPELPDEHESSADAATRLLSSDFRSAPPVPPTRGAPQPAAGAETPPSPTPVPSRQAGPVWRRPAVLVAAAGTVLAASVALAVLRPREAPTVAAAPAVADSTRSPDTSRTASAGRNERTPPPKRDTAAGRQVALPAKDIARPTQLAVAPTTDASLPGDGAHAAGTQQFARTVGPAPLPADSVNAAIARVRQLADTNSSDADLDRALAETAALLPRLAGRADSVRTLYYRAKAFGLKNDERNACEILGSLRQLARGTAFAGGVADAYENMSCP